jgi:hypothetical protein
MAKPLFGRTKPPSVRFGNAMGEREIDPDPTRCWQCGAPADPSAEYVQLLNSRPRQHPDPQDQKVKRGRWQDAAWVHVPRCATCQARNWITAGICFVAFFAGGAIGGLGFPSDGWTTIVGGFGCVIPLVFGMRAYERWRGLRSLIDYPPLRRMMAGGWDTPN